MTTQVKAQISLYDSVGAAVWADQVLQVWGEAFGPVGDVEEWRETVWDRHRLRADYRLVIAAAGVTCLGFAWGYTGVVGQYWPDRVLAALGEDGSAWVGGHFEFVELAVGPGARGQGLGGRLHDQLLADLPHSRALLGTSADERDPAVRLYRSRGWRQLGLLDHETQVMGRRFAIEGQHSTL